mmetsp:Transcript_59011/g.140925  ORF Transcript_59011/g.140925 Transcript_59011/m.140925 type:complete len:240 (+) Transcript_59011:545-1264(+)
MLSKERARPKLLERAEALDAELLRKLNHGLAASGKQAKEELIQVENETQSHCIQNQVLQCGGGEQELAPCKEQGEGHHQTRKNHCKKHDNKPRDADSIHPESVCPSLGKPCRLCPWQRNEGRGEPDDRRNLNDDGHEPNQQNQLHQGGPYLKIPQPRSDVLEVQSKVLIALEGCRVQFRLSSAHVFATHSRHETCLGQLIVSPNIVANAQSPEEQPLKESVACLFLSRNCRDDLSKSQL